MRNLVRQIRLAIKLVRMYEERYGDEKIDPERSSALIREHYGIARDAKYRP